MRGRVHARRTLKGLVADLRFDIMFFGVFEEHSGFNRGFMETVNIEKTFKI